MNTLYKKIKSFNLSIFESKNFSGFIFLIIFLFFFYHLIYLIFNTSLPTSIFKIKSVYLFLLIIFIIYFLKIKKKETLQEKVFSGIRNYILLLFIFGISLYIIFENFVFESSLKNIIEPIFDYSIFIIIILMLMYFILKFSLEKHIFSRLDLLYDEMKQIKDGDFSKRLSIQGSDELDKIIFFNNLILDKFENTLKIEKENALIDPLTFCYNRRGLNLNFKIQLSTAKRKKTNLCLALIDIDDFKKINDTFGHDVGDKVLVELSKSIKKSIRSTDSVYRTGGEEFVILFPDFKSHQTKATLDRIRKNISYHLSKKLTFIEKKITISGGFVCSKQFKIENQSEIDVLNNMMKKADLLLYKAKKSGKNKILTK